MKSLKRIAGIFALTLLATWGPGAGAAGLGPGERQEVVDQLLEAGHVAPRGAFFPAFN